MSDDPILAALAELRTDLTGQLDLLRADMMARIDRVTNAITAIRDDITVNFGRADRAQEAAEGTRRELRALGGIVAGMERQIQHLQTDVRQLKGEP